VVMGTELVPVMVTSTAVPSLRVEVKVVVNGWSEVETRGVVLVVSCVRTEDTGALLDSAGAPAALLRCVGVFWPWPWLEAGAGAGVDAAGRLEVTGSGVESLVVVVTGCADD
jgi:hypothetical protein